MALYCCACRADVPARLTDGEEIYPHRADLADLPFWKCDACNNFVGCHHQTKNRTHPLGCIPSPEIKNARKKIHALIDPVWQSGRMTRRDLYQAISADVGWKYHTAAIRSIEEARAVWRASVKILREHNGVRQ